jgi:hypothetical protein
LHIHLQLPDTRYLVLVRASAQQAEQYEAEARAARIRAIHEAAGFAAVFDLMRRRWVLHGACKMFNIRARVAVQRRATRPGLMSIMPCDCRGDVAVN